MSDGVVSDGVVSDGVVGAAGVVRSVGEAVGEAATEAAILWPWAAGLVAVAVVVVAVVAWRRRARPVDPRWVARTADLAAVPGIRRAMRRALAVRGLGAAALLVATASMAVLVTRPITRETHVPATVNRDIVLCLDVSGSMTAFDTEIVRTFEQLVAEFDGERIALSVFNSTSRTVFPLTDDYALVLDELALAADGLSFDVNAVLDPDDKAGWEQFERYLDITAGTIGVPGEGSLIGDGLASCALLFDEQQTERSRSIILATDNEVFGHPIYTLPEAVQVVTGRGVTMYALHAGTSESRDSQEYAELADAVAGAQDAQGHGGTWSADDPGAVRRIVEDVSAQQEDALRDRGTIVVVDRPWPWSVVGLGALAVVLALRWRSRS